MLCKVESAGPLREWVETVLSLRDRGLAESPPGVDRLQPGGKAGELLLRIPGVGGGEDRQALDPQGILISGLQIVRECERGIPVAVGRAVEGGAQIQRLVVWVGGRRRLV